MTISSVYTNHLCPVTLRRLTMKCIYILKIIGLKQLPCGRPEEVERILVKLNGEKKQAPTSEKIGDKIRERGGRFKDCRWES